MTPNELEIVESYLDSILQNRPVAPLEDAGRLQVIEDKFLQLSSLLQELKLYAVRLSSGDVDAPPPGRSNFLASGLKQLQAQMLHLTWQAQRVAQGDYRQRIDFMGDFSKAFNEMVEQLRSREASLKEQQEVMEKIFNMVESIFVISEAAPGDVLYANETALHRFGLRTGTNPKLSRILTSIVGISPGSIEHQLFDADTNKWYGVTARALYWGNEHQARLYYCRDITQHKVREYDLDIVANTDELTGINNRRAFDQTYARQWDICKNAHKPLSVIMFDLDHFKQFNDTYGHMEGDKMLAEFASILKRCITRKDDLIARYGGEEFIAALPFTEQDHAIRIAKTINEMTEKRQLLVRDGTGASVKTSISVSVGVSTVIPVDAVLPSDLIKSADQALYEAKKTGRNRVCYQFVMQ